MSESGQLYNSQNESILDIGLRSIDYNCDLGEPSNLNDRLKKPEFTSLSRFVTFEVLNQRFDGEEVDYGAEECKSGTTNRGRKYRIDLNTSAGTIA